ncbi:MAG: hypothetical protein U1C70_06840 [Sediminibacterium sp.]|jgi:hypothetical protein|uniref:hypothetical protein n=1 Tax=Sediminibacterium sp. TaxID=1917865 RepID=UPI002ABCDE81|nr:hypothetical protein [Sediminibacterium sp.]MDZ4071521.1 hypothetical protein [Sediminibacterium sp.]
MTVKEQRILAIEDALIGFWFREDNQLFMFFHPTSSVGKTGKLHASEQEILVPITPPMEYKIVLTDAKDEPEFFETWLHTIDKDEVKEYRIWFLNGGAGQFRLLNDEGVEMYFSKITPYTFQGK